ncbi:MAG TPA: hypothetical protein VFZ64_15865 [Nocardioidaceae bacterium]
MNRSLKALLVSAGALALGMTMPGGAVAQPYEREHYSWSDSHIEQEEHEDFCPDVEFEVLFTGEGDGFFQGVTHGDGLVYYADHFRVTETYTNTENGKTLTFKRAMSFKDQKIVDDGENLIITFKGTGTTRTYGPDGRLLFVDAGQFVVQDLIDHAGTPGDPSDDEWQEFLGLLKEVGRTDTAERDFCADLNEFLG